MSEFHIGSVNSGRDTNLESSLGAANSNNSNTTISIEYTHSIDVIKNGIDDEHIKYLLDELKLAIEHKDEPSIGQCIMKLGTSATTLGKLAYSAIKALL